MSITPHPDLLKKAQRIRQSEYFMSDPDWGHLRDKQQLFLTLAGIKPVSEIYAAHTEPTEDGGWQSVPDDPKGVAELLDSLGLAHRFLELPHYILAVVTRDPQTLQTFWNCKDDAERGKLLGYPQTAIDAYMIDRRMPGDKQDAIMEHEGLSQLYGFCLSRTHYTEEIQTLRTWRTLLQAYGLWDETKDIKQSGQPAA